MLVLYISIFRHNTTYLQHVPIYLQLLPMHHTYTHNTYLPTTSTYIKYTTISNTHAPKTPTYLQDIPTSHTYHMHVSLPMATHALNVYTHQFFYRIFCKLYVPTLSSLPTSCGLRRRRNPNFPCMYTAPSNNSNRQKLSLKNIFQSLQYINLMKSLTINI